MVNSFVFKNWVDGCRRRIFSISKNKRLFKNRAERRHGRTFFEGKIFKKRVKGRRNRLLETDILHGRISHTSANRDFESILKDLRKFRLVIRRQTHFQNNNRL